MDSRQPNPPRTAANIWWIITALAVFGIFFPQLFGIKDLVAAMIIIVCVILAFIGLIVALIFMAWARKLDKMLKGENLLAHWTYSQDEWQQYAEEEYKRQKSRNMKQFIMVAIASLVIGVGCVVLIQRNGLWFLLAMIVLIALEGLIAWFTADYNHRQNKKSQGQAFLAPDAVFITNHFHNLKSTGYRLEKVELKGDSQPYIEFIYSGRSQRETVSINPLNTGHARDNYYVTVPVPQGKVDEAIKVVEKYNSI